MKRKIIQADILGFCRGVEQAVDLAKEYSTSNEVLYCLGDLVHNRDLMEQLAQRGVVVVDAQSVPEKSLVLLRAHGVPPQVEETLKAKGCTIIDGTCGKVKGSQLWVKKYSDRGFQVIVAGDAGHGEVLGLMGYGDKVQVIDSVEQLEQLSIDPQVLLLSQTTFNTDKFNQISQRLCELNPKAVIKNTICNATAERQNSLKSLLPRVEAMVIIGGRNSANTKRLYQTAKKSGTPSWMVERAAELELKDLKDFKTIGITAGASTPDFLIEELYQLLQDF